jgi:hypothetical protein
MAHDSSADPHQRFIANVSVSSLLACLQEWTAELWRKEFQIGDGYLTLQKASGYRKSDAVFVIELRAGYTDLSVDPPRIYRDQGSAITFGCLELDGLGVARIEVHADCNFGWEALKVFFIDLVSEIRRLWMPNATKDGLHDDSKEKLLRPEYPVDPKDSRLVAATSTEKYRIIIAMTNQGKKPHQIAAMMNIPREQINSDKSRIKKKKGLAALLDPKQ